MAIEYAKIEHTKARMCIPFKSTLNIFVRPLYILLNLSLFLSCWVDLKTVRLLLTYKEKAKSFFYYLPPSKHIFQIAFYLKFEKANSKTHLN